MLRSRLDAAFEEYANNHGIELPAKQQSPQEKKAALTIGEYLKGKPADAVPSSISEAAPEAAQPQPQPAALTGEARYNFDKDFQGKAMRGHNRGLLGDDLHAVPDEVLNVHEKAAVEQHAKIKLMLDASEHRLEDASNQAYALFGDGTNPIKIGKVVVSPPKSERRLGIDGQDALNIARDKFSDFVSELKGSSLRATAGTSPKLFAPLVQISSDPATAAHMLESLKGEVSEMTKAYKASSQTTGKVMRASHERLQTISPGKRLTVSVPVTMADGVTVPVNVEHVNQRMERVFAQEAFEKARKADPELQPEAFYAQWEKARSEALGIEPRPTAQVISESAHNLQSFKLAVEQIDKQFGYNKDIAGSVNWARKTALPAATAISASLEGGHGATAADGEDNSQEQGGMPITVALAALSAAGIGAKVLAKYGPKAVREFLGSAAGFAANLYRDTMDHVQILDGALGLGETTGLYRKAWERQAAIVRAGLGVQFASLEQKAIAQSLLKDKLVSPVDALNGAPGTVFETMTQEQREALVAAHLNVRALAGEVRAYRHHLEAAITAGKINKDKLKSSLYALDYLENQISPRSRDRNELEDAFNSRASNLFDFLFALNPRFHALNLSDSFIAGGSRVGPLRVARAWLALATDPELMKLLSNSGLVGGNHRERLEQSVLATGKKQNVDLHNLPIPSSDHINADRVFLAAMLEHFGDDMGQVKELLKC